MGGNRITELNSNLPLTSNDAVSWLRVVQLVRDSERETETKVSKSGDVVSGDRTGGPGDWPETGDTC